MIQSVLNICKKMLYENPFFGSVLITLQKEISTKIPTAAVGLNGVAFKLIVNPDFWESLPEKQQRGLIKHELGHIINFHLTEYDHLKDHEIANIAMDIYINQHIPLDELPPNPCMWDKYKGLLPTMDTNWYYKKLAENYKDKSCKNTVDSIDNLKQGSSEVTLENGDKISLPQHKWDDVRNTSEALKKIISKNLQTDLKEIIKNSSPGSVPGGIEELLQRLMKIEPPKFNWGAYVRNFVGTSTRTDVRKTNRKKSKRFPDMKGNKEHYYSHILLALDTSASFTTEELKEAQNEMHHLNKLGHDITVVLCDTKISKQFKFNPREDIQIKGRGGTSFQPVIDLFREAKGKYSCCIYFTDGEASTPTNPKGRILWVHSSKSKINHSLPGQCIKLP